MFTAVDQQIQIRLTTTEDKHYIEQNVFSVSSKLSSVELQDLLKNLLDISDNDIEFSFRVGEQILQSSIGKYCEDANFSGESILEISYFEKTKVPDESVVISLDDWVGGVAITNSNIYCGLYNGQLARICGHGKDTSSEVTVYSIHEKPIKSVAFVKKIEENGEMKDIVITSSLDHSLCFNSVSEKSLDTLYSFKGHTGTVTSASVSPSTEQIASGSWDTYLKVWSTSMSEPCDIEQRKKRKKNTGPTSPLIRTPLLTLGGHAQAVTGCCWKDNIQVITTSMDMSVKLWDTQTLTCVKTLSINSSLQCVDWSNHSQLIVTGSSDKYIRLFDLRGESGTIVHSTLQGHEGWVPSVKWSPSSDVQLVSGAYDGMSLLWDIRSPKSYLAVVGTHEDKVLCTDWKDGRIVSGGADNKLRITNMP